MKTCSKCHLHKPLEEFNRDKHNKDGLDHRCRSCSREKGLHYYHNNVSLHKDRILRWRFGITLERFNWLKEQQHNLCFSCGQPEIKIDKRTGKVYELSVHHDHDTGRVLCLLCYDCNAASGRLKEDPEITSRLLAVQRMWKECDDIDFRDAA